MAIIPDTVPNEAMLSDEAFEAWLDARFEMRMAGIFGGITAFADKVDAILDAAGAED